MNFISNKNVAYRLVSQKIKKFPTSQQVQNWNRTQKNKISQHMFNALPVLINIHRHDIFIMLLIIVFTPTLLYFIFCTFVLLTYYENCVCFADCWRTGEIFCGIITKHNLEHNSPFLRVTPKSIIFDFRSIMCQPLELTGRCREVTVAERFQ